MPAAPLAFPAAIAPGSRGRDRRSPDLERQSALCGGPPQLIKWNRDAGTRLGAYEILALIGFWQNGQLKKVSAAGAPIVLCEAENPSGVSWTIDTTILYGQSDELGAN
jgi:hypothetical protein